MVIYMLFFRKKQIEPIAYDKENLQPIIRSSICTGEKVAGFKNIHTGKFSEIMLIRNSKDVDRFMDTYQLTAAEVKKEY